MEQYFLGPTAGDSHPANIGATLCDDATGIADTYGASQALQASTGHPNSRDYSLVSQKVKFYNTSPLPLAISAAMLYECKTKSLSAVTDTTREKSTPPTYLLSFSAIFIFDFSLFLVSGLSQTEEQLQLLYIH